jgi:hypothetical protein
MHWPLKVNLFFAFTPSAVYQSWPQRCPKKARPFDTETSEI